MKNILLWLFNNPISRFVIAIIMAGTFAAPFINGFSDNVTWAIVGTIFLLSLSSLVHEFKFTDKTVWILYVVTGAFIGLIIYLYFTYAN